MEGTGGRAAAEDGSIGHEGAEGVGTTLPFSLSPQTPPSPWQVSPIQAQVNRDQPNLPGSLQGILEGDREAQGSKTDWGVGCQPACPIQGSVD